jgi:hypothetical protein
LLLAACGGASHPTTQELGTTHDEAQTKGTAPAIPAKPDPTLAFRQQYQDPGGMWLPEQMKLPGHVEAFKNLGVQIPAESLADPLAAPLAAVVSLGGCTASFVSPKGLIVTNHHCVQGAAQYNSTPEHNYVEQGFLAANMGEEKPAGPTQRVYVAQSFTDVTAQMRDGLDKIKDPIARKETSEKRFKELQSQCEAGHPELRCNVKSYFRGGLWILTANLEIRDVRLVYTPARSIGNFGGEVDNWHWPRHTGDWSYFRAYVGKDGKPADFSPDNVPFEPKSWLHVTTAGLQPADFVMIAGYPGSTSRTSTAADVHFDLEWRYPTLVKFLQARYDIADAHIKDGGETGIKAGVTKQFTQNGLAKFQGTLDGLKRGDLVAQKDALDKKVKDWAAQPGHEKEKAAIDRLEAIDAEARRTAAADFDRNQAFGGSRLLSTALSFTRWAEERTKKDAERKPGFQERDMNPAMAGQKAFAKQYDRTLDRANFRLALVWSMQLDEKQRPWLATLLGVKRGAKIDEALIDKTLDAWYGAQTIEDEKVRTELLSKGTLAQLKASKDPFIMAAQRVWPIVKAEEKKSDARQGDLLLVTPAYVDAMKAVLGGMVAPDANSSLRVTYGTVKSFKPESKDAADAPFTTATQILAKQTGKEPFDAPDKEIAAIKAKKFGPYGDPALGGDLPVDFLSDLDITGGNSGSPVMNNKGELVGLAFDGTISGLASDVVFDPAVTRTIQVDARYMIWVMDSIDHAHWLITEMGLTPKM